jgi:hypothetical protein
MTPKAQITTTTKRKDMNYVKVTNFCDANRTIRKV